MAKRKTCQAVNKMLSKVLNKTKPNPKKPDPVLDMDWIVNNYVPGKSHVIYSAYKTDEHDEPVNNLYEVAIRGKVILCREKSVFYGGNKSQDYVSKVLLNPTWLALAVHANMAIRKTRDLHHTFFEGVTRTKRKIDGVKVYELVMGS